MNVSFTSLVNLASESLGGTAVSASDEFFAPCKNLTRDAAAVFLGDKYTEQGKWMDGWESRRKREPGHDWCIVKLGLRGVVRGVDVDTSHFLGNFPEACSLEGTDSDDPKMAKWRPLAERTALRGGMRNLIAIADPGSITHLRLNIYPDGGVARLRVYGEVAPPALKGLVDLAALASGGRAICCSDMFFSHKDNLILPGRSPFMGGGWETKRRRGPGFDWIIVKLATTGKVERVEIDTDHYKGNYPDRASLEGLESGEDLSPTDFRDRDLKWDVILPQTKLEADFRHVFAKELRGESAVSYVRLSIFPDGGIARLRVFGRAGA